MRDDDSKDWLRQHSIVIVDDNKRAYRYSRQNIKYFTFDDDYDRITNIPVEMVTEPLLTIEIAESELRRIMEFEQQVFNNMREHGHYGMFEILMQQKEEEKRLREKNPAVKKAFEHYSLLLKLAKENE